MIKNSLLHKAFLDNAGFKQKYRVIIFLFEQCKYFISTISKSVFNRAPTVRRESHKILVQAPVSDITSFENVKCHVDPATGLFLPQVAVAQMLF